MSQEDGDKENEQPINYGKETKTENQILAGS